MDALSELRSGQWVTNKAWQHDDCGGNLMARCIGISPHGEAKYETKCSKCGQPLTAKDGKFV